MHRFFVPILAVGILAAAGFASAGGPRGHTLGADLATLSPGGGAALPHPGQSLAAEPAPATCAAAEAPENCKAEEVALGN